MDIEELLERYAAGERDFRDVDLSHSDLTGVNLSGIDLSEDA
ncbi:MAG: pentapeptide repeat-containing protein, partial [Nostoc sp.]